MLRCAVVEDEILIRKNMVKKIKACGADIEVVCEAGNGRDALAYIRKREVDLVVTDIQMPILDGLSLARDLAEEFPEVIVVIVSGFDNFTYAQQAIRYHVFDYLLKPVQADLLMETINGVRVKVQVREQDAYEKEAEQKKQNAQRGVGTEKNVQQGQSGRTKQNQKLEFVPFSVTFRSITPKIFRLRSWPKNFIFQIPMWAAPLKSSSESRRFSI